ncbi:MAG: 5-formyltetrahydrofolate cyclo-ligase [Desulfobulbaceae bacterium]|nr:5-formyltetrahydrofolate cyclo-ligase [Desulfobulbaceae bacterium]
MDRQTLRKNILATRDALPETERRAKSAAIIKNLWEIKEFSDSRAPFIYVHFRSEAETDQLISQCLTHNKEVIVPLTLTQEKRLDPYLITDPKTQLVSGYCNIPEPDPKKATLFDAMRIDVVILPGSVFDAKGGRLGYGGGYYDRFLTDQAPQALRIGIAYEMQLVAEVPLLPHDQRLDYLVTEKRIIRIND